MSAPPGSNPPPDDNTALAQWLSGRDVPCPQCGYNLRSLSSPRCPECGHVLRLSLSPPDPATAPWTLLLFFASIGAGMGVILILLWMNLGLGDELKYRIPVYLIIAMIPLSVIAAFSRRLFLAKLRRRTQWWIAALTAAAVVGCIIRFYTF
jgi:hypothetical protein